MRRNDIKQLHTLETKDLQSKLAELRKSLEQVRLDKIMGKVKNVKQIESTRKDIARVMTVLSGKV
jgi:ribosomal protein L29